MGQQWSLEIRVISILILPLIKYAYPWGWAVAVACWVSSQQRLEALDWIPWSCARWTAGVQSRTLCSVELCASPSCHTASGACCAS